MTKTTCDSCGKLETPENRSNWAFLAAIGPRGFPALGFCGDCCGELLRILATGKLLKITEREEAQQ